MDSFLDSYYSSFKAEDYHLGAKSTLKKVTFEKWHEGSQYPRIGVMKYFLKCREEFKKEAHYLMRAAKCHHAVLQFYHEMVINDQYHIFMEYCEKDSLGDIISNNRQNQQLWSINQRLNYFITITEALAALHKAGIAHRDVKPNNIFLNENNEIKIGDFGESKEIRFGDQNTVLGTGTYMSPFLAKCSEANICKSKLIQPFKEDVWSTGKTLYEIAIMNTYTDLPKSEEKLKSRVRHDLEICQFPDGVIDVILDMLIYDNKKRPSMAEVCDRLKSESLSKISQHLECKSSEETYETENQNVKEGVVDWNDLKLTKNEKDLRLFSLSSFCEESEKLENELLEEQTNSIGKTEISSQFDKDKSWKLCLINDKFIHGCGIEMDREVLLSFIDEILHIETDYSNVFCSGCGHSYPREMFIK